MTDRAGRSSPRRKCGLARALGASTMLLAAGGCDGDPFQASQQGTELATATAAEAASGGVVFPVAEETPARPESANPVLQPAPELFAAEEWALWDGRQTLGGSWVALPDIGLSRRVRLTDPETGVAVDGALIRRDPGQAGPRLIISSEAARSLGLRPGVAAAVTIIALAYAVAETEPEETLATEGLPRAEQPAAVDGAAGADGSPPVVEAAMPAAPEVVAASAEAADAAGPETVERPEVPDFVAGDAAGTAPAPVPDAPAAPAMQPETGEPAAPAAPEPIADGLPYIQAGIFGDPANATRLIDRLRAAGLPADGHPATSGARTLTRVVVGPYRNVDERDRALETVRQIGPEDATPVRG